MMSQSKQGASWVQDEDGAWHSPNEVEETELLNLISDTRANVYSSTIGSLNKLPSDGG